MTEAELSDQFRIADSLDYIKELKDNFNGRVTVQHISVLWERPDQFKNVSGETVNLQFVKKVKDASPMQQRNGTVRVSQKYV